MEPIVPRAPRHKFTAVRDGAGVPHVEAEDWAGALYALGYLHGIDRPTQLYFARAVGSGRAAERIANRPELLEMDRFLRRAGVHRGLQQEADELAPAVLEQLGWYCDGVNDAILEIGRSLPMWVTGFTPQPWDAEAVLLIGNLLSFAGLAVGEQESERLLLELIQLAPDDQRLRELFSPYLDGIDLELLREIRITRRLSDDALELLTDLPRLAGSNAWAVSPQRSASGAALLAADPHLEVNRLPAIWYEAVLNWGEGRYAMGATLPGAPLMSVGRTPRLSWGVTYLVSDTSDFFIEDCRPGGESGWQYRRGAQWCDFKLRTETLGRKGAETEEMAVLENEVGVLMQTPPANSPGKYLSAAWVGSRPGGGRSIQTWLDVMAAADVQEAMRAVRDSPHPSLVWVFADRDGHIGKQASGWLPDRGPGRSGVVPIPAWDERNHWRGLVPSDQLPGEYDPPIGFVASANEEAYRTDGPPLHAFSLPDYRKRRICERLTELPQATLADMQALQYDVLSVQARDLLPVLLAEVEPGPLRDRLAAWDLRYDPDNEGAPLFQAFYRGVLLEVFGHEEGLGWRRMLYLSTRVGFSQLVLTAADRLLRKVTSSWWREGEKGEMIRRAAARVAVEPRQPWRAVNSFQFTNRFFGGGMTGRLLGFDSSSTAMPGCHATPFQGHLLTTATRTTTFAPSYHFVTDMGVDEAHTNLPGGPCESVFSKWYHSDVKRWTEGKYKCLSPAAPGKKNGTTDSTDDKG
ncbi:Acyl-homoserine lactone acylase QuiP precursor [Pirellulimonas nuda]|uniref:Acyl-homoserine lactone acylase QuiP n=1 Tax=Pirellulimonas nuda TaxID=2528009 RepID=A0A518DIS7_9BACT|nr:penicillin acylase family protein [Pirellulimonas nuda]QDU91374.1 Acyl-homoserine lactone acylase QuiP precursor [Pirellulimonas nuda]